MVTLRFRRAFLICVLFTCLSASFAASAQVSGAAAEDMCICPALSGDTAGDDAAAPGAADGADTAQTPVPDAEPAADSGGGTAFSESDELYTVIGQDLTWQEIQSQDLLAQGKASVVPSATVDVNNALVEQGPNAATPVPQDISLHTLASSNIRRAQIDNWKRWYQEDGNTQIFRVFEGEENVRNDRKYASRSEAFFPEGHRYGDGWHEFSATYLIPGKLSANIFQAKTKEFNWIFSMSVSGNGHLRINRRKEFKKTPIKQNITREPFHVSLRDNGRNYEFYVNGQFVASGDYEREDAETNFRWGIYASEDTHQFDSMVFVIGASQQRMDIDPTAEYTTEEAKAALGSWEVFPLD